MPKSELPLSDTQKTNKPPKFIQILSLGQSIVNYDQDPPLVKRDDSLIALAADGTVWYWEGYWYNGGWSKMGWYNK